MCKPKYLYWLTSRGAYSTSSPLGFNGTNKISPNSMCNFQVMFNQLPDAKAYRLRCEQFSINSTGITNGVVHEIPVVGASTNNGIPSATGLVELTGFSPINGSVVAESAEPFTSTGTTAGSGTCPPQQKCYLTRFDTSFMSTPTTKDCSVSPPHSPEVLIHKPANGNLGVIIKGIVYPNGLLIIDDGATRRQSIGDWVLCFSLEPMTDKELDAYYNINQD